MTDKKKYNKSNKKSKNNKGDIDITKEYKVKKHKPNTKRRKILKSILLIIFLIILISSGIVFAILYASVKDAKLNISDLAIKYENSVVTDKDGKTIAVLSGDENRKFISISEMAEYLPKAFVSIEDERFYDHMGIDVKRTIAATFKYLLSKIGIGSADYGGSTITQQTIKNITNEKDKTWQRKVKELSRAYYLEKELSKDQILELYLNLIFMGGNTNIFGVEVASNYYFSKSAKDLDLAECAFLAGINNTPNTYDPFIEDNAKVLDLIKVRTKVVLNKMKELGNIKSQEDYDTAIAEVDEGLKFNKGTIVENIYSYHTDAAIMQIINQLMEEKDLDYEAAKLYLYAGGFTIYTTQDTAIQNIMNEEAKKEKYIKTANGQTSQAAMALIDHKTGYVVGIIGGLGEKTTSLGYNRATQATKQTGSAMKPLAVLAPAIDKGIITAATVFDDVPYGGFKNYGNYRGLVTVRYAIESSQNIPMVKAMQQLGTEKSIEFLKSVGITNLVDADNNLGLALGGLTHGTNVTEMAAAYGAIANDGIYIKPTFYTKVVDGNGNTVLEPHQDRRTVMSKAAAYVVKEILTQPVKSGTSTYCGISGMSVAAKTGTTNDDYDRWMCGFTPYYSAATWYGYDQNRTVKGWRINPAGTMFSSVFKQVHKDLERRTFAQTCPDGVVSATVCKDSGLLVTDICKEDQRGNRAYTEYFVKGTVPTKRCDCHIKVDICVDTGLLANEYCPNKETKVFITRPDWETNTGWKRTADAKYMFTIKDICNVHKEVLDRISPVITLRGKSEMTININETFIDPGATATDNKDGDITSKIKKYGKVNTSKAGIYTIVYVVEDSAANSTKVERKIIVNAKIIEPKPPEIGLFGEAEMKIKVGGQFKDPGAWAKDEKDGDLTNKIEKKGSVDTSKEGIYSIQYTVYNSNEKKASVTRKIFVYK